MENASAAFLIVVRKPMRAIRCVLGDPWGINRQRQPHCLIRQRNCQRRCCRASGNHNLPVELPNGRADYQAQDGEASDLWQSQDRSPAGPLDRFRVDLANVIIKIASETKVDPPSAISALSRSPTAAARLVCSACGANNRRPPEQARGGLWHPIWARPDARVPGVL
jgi:hypothetical protein